MRGPQGICHMCLPALATEAVQARVEQVHAKWLSANVTCNFHIIEAMLAHVIENRVGSHAAEGAVVQRQWKVTAEARTVIRMRFAWIVVVARFTHVIVAHKHPHVAACTVPA